MAGRLARYPLPALFLALALIELSLLPPGIKSVDEISMYTVTESLVNGNGFHVPCSLIGVPGEGGGCYSSWYPLLSILAVPLVALAHLMASVGGFDSAAVSKAIAPAVSALSAAGAGAFTAGIARRMGASWGAAVLAAVAFAFGTEALTHARSFFAETLCAVCAAGAVYALGAGDETARRRWLGFAALVLAPLAKPPMIVLGPAIGLARAISARDPRKVLAPTAASLAGIAVYMLYNYARFRDATEFGGESRSVSLSDYLSLDAIEALGLFTISPGRGMLWFSPVAVLGAVGLARRYKDPLPLCCGLVSLAILAFYLANPGIGDNWGTRYLVPAMPMLCAGLVLLPPRVKGLTIALVVLGMLIQVPTTLAFYSRYFAELRDRGNVPTDVYWSVTDSPLIQSWPAMVRELKAAKDSDVKELVDRQKKPFNVNKSEPATKQELLQVVALWWWMLPGVGIPLILGLGLAIAMLAAGVVMLRALARIRE